MTRNRSCLWVAYVALLAAVTGCTDEVALEVDPGLPQTSVPAPNTNGPDPDDPNGQSPSISLPSLPIGGNANESADISHPNNQCVDVNWIVEPGSAATLSSGIAVEVTGFVFTPSVFVVADAGCDDNNPPCPGFVFTVAAQVCNLAVMPAIDGDMAVENSVVALAGRVDCQHVGPKECDRFANAAEAEQNLSIELITPQISPTASSTPSPTESPTGSPTASEPTGSATPDASSSEDVSPSTGDPGGG